ncbi:MAG: xanthine dehydrogenase family protein molybdopterin-binding subunit [Firmicutes bacterium]|nr:xanthine dehydrogenase family protein molybdopterin-binding subunit [Bacillota bacterium]
MSVIGKNTPRIDGPAKVSGKQKYASDIIIPGMMYAVTLRSPYPHAEIVSIDTSEAEAMGAVCLTYEDINPVLYNERSVSVPAATYRDRTVLPKKARHVGEPIAAVAADTEELAYKAMKTLKVEYKVLDPVFDPVEAMKDGAPQLYDKIYLGDEEVTIKNNIGVVRKIDEGDCDAGFAKADRIFEEDFELPRIYHCQLETKGCVAAPDSEGGITVWATAQSIHGNRHIIARVLGLPLSKVNVKKVTLGGGFGSSIQVNTVTPICAALAMKARRPVKLLSAREEDFYSHHKYPAQFHVKIGVTNDGVITAAHVKALIDFGSHQIQPMAFMGCVAGWFASLYKYEGNIRFDGTAVYTNKTPCCAMQGYGNPQVNFAIESMVDVICNEMGFDPIQFRLANYRGTGEEFWGQGPTIRSIIKSCGVEESLIEGAKLMPEWATRNEPKDMNAEILTGVGLARGFHCSGTAGPKEGEVIDYSSAMVKVNEDGSIDCVSPVMDHGGGTWDALAKILTEVFKVPLSMVCLSPADTKNTGYDVCTHATRGVYCGGAAVYNAAVKCRDRLLEFAGRAMDEHPSHLEISPDEERGQGYIHVKGFPAKGRTIGEVAKLAQINSWGTAMYAESFRQKNCPPCFTTHFVKVAVNTRTGEITIPKVVIYGDCGVAMNPELLHGQLIGSFNRGLGYVLYENLPHDYDTGKLKNNGLLVDYKMPTAVEMPTAENVIARHANTYEPTGPFGAKGIGEAALASVQAAIANAIYNATGIRFTKLPITPEIMLKALQEHGLAHK